MPFKEETFTFIWKIENFNFSTKRVGESIISPCFKLQSMDKTNWYLKCYPRGVRNRLFIVIKLHRGEDSGPETIDIGFKAYVIAFDGSSPFTEETESISLEKGNEIKIIRELRDTFLNRPRILSNGDTLTICCEIWKHCKDNITIKPSSVIDNKSHFGEDFQTVYEGVSKDFTGISKIQDLNPVKFYAKTQMQVERKTFVYLVKDFSILQKPHNESFTIYSTSDLTPTLLLTINFSEHLSKTEFYIRPLVKKLNRSIFLKCNLVLTHKEIPLSVISYGHLFNPSETLVWRIAFGNCNFPVEQNLCFSEDELSLRFELDICNGTEISSIEKVIYATPEKETKKDNTLMEYLLNYYKEQIFCDVELRVANETVSAHKAVLCSRSAAFRKIFENERESKQARVVRIENIDIQTLRNMLEFMYLETFEHLGFEEIMKLYSAAVIYGYENLKKSCFSFLSSNMQSTNVCKILKLSNYHNDEELKTISLDYIRLHANEVLSLGEWKTFVLENILLASETIGYISSVIQKAYS